ncbi:hypothetical protein BC828DRAFT_403486 [Blastocladiella britannica]|nr:hypothetical protein BC828DRAFT_403486 [Blastocladiella britannica]
MYIVREATRSSCLPVLEWWRDEILAAIPRGTECYPRPRDLKLVLAKCTSIHTIMFWNQVILDRGYRVPIFSVSEAVMATSQDDQVAALEYWCISAGTADRKLVQVARECALSQNKMVVVAWCKSIIS